MLRRAPLLALLVLGVLAAPAEARITTCNGNPIDTWGTRGNDFIELHGFEYHAVAGLAGDDSLQAGEGNAALCGGPGRDTLRGGPFSDGLYGGKGNDTLFAYTQEGEIDRVFGGKGFDHCYGEPTDVYAGCEYVYFE